MVLAATAGSTIGASALHAVSAAVGPDRVRAFVVRRCRRVGVKPSDLERAETWFDRRDDAAVLLCRCVPLVRSLVSVPAGLRPMDRLRLTADTAIGSTTWNTALILVGYAASSHQEVVADALGHHPVHGRRHRGGRRRALRVAPPRLAARRRRRGRRVALRRRARPRARGR